MPNLTNKFQQTRCALACVMAFTLLCLASCISDDLDDCGLNLRFRYTYNVKNADAFAEEVRRVDVYVFNSDGKFVKLYSETGNPFASDYAMNFRDMPSGNYTFVALGSSNADIEADGGFSYSGLIPGKSTVADLNMRLGKAADGTNSHDFAALYSGKVSVDYDNTPQTVYLDMMRLTNTYRIILMSSNSALPGLDTSMFDVRITGNAAWLSHDGSMLQEDDVCYLPHNAERLVYDEGQTSVSGEPLDQALIYDLNSSRLFVGNTTQRLIITDKKSGHEMFNHSLPWLLSLYGGDERRSGWSDQQYLDRQDHYVLTFYIGSAQPGTGEYNLSVTVSVNGWVLNLLNPDLM